MEGKRFVFLRNCLFGRGGAGGRVSFPKKLLTGGNLFSVRNFACCRRGEEGSVFRRNFVPGGGGGLPWMVLSFVSKLYIYSHGPLLAFIVLKLTLILLLFMGTNIPVFCPEFNS